IEPLFAHGREVEHLFPWNAIGCRPFLSSPCPCPIAGFPHFPFPVPSFPVPPLVPLPLPVPGRESPLLLALTRFPMPGENDRPMENVVLTLMAHPDDAEILCGGTLALLAELGWKIHVATATPGDCGSSKLKPDEIAEIRRSEARRAAEV